MPQVAIKTGSKIVRVIATYRVGADDAKTAREVVKEHYENQKLPSNIKLIDKEVLGLKGLL